MHAYLFGIFSSTTISQLDPNNALVQNIGYGNIVKCFYLPGCIVGGLFMDRIGHKQTMCLRFVFWSLLGFIIGRAMTLILSGLHYSSSSMGSSMPSVKWPRRCYILAWCWIVLSTHTRPFLGFAAAVGKAGATTRHRSSFQFRPFSMMREGTCGEYISLVQRSLCVAASPHGHSSGTAGESSKAKTRGSDSTCLIMGTLECLMRAW